MKPELLCISLFLLCLSCGTRTETTQTASAEGGLKHARRFALVQGDNFTDVVLFGNRHNFDTTNIFRLSSDTALLEGLPARVQGIRLPCRSVAALSSIYASMFEELGSLEALVAIDNIDYVNNKKIIERFRSGQLAELARTPDIALEPAIRLKPDVIFYYGMGDGEGRTEQRLRQAGIPVALSVDHLEADALGRAEWIKFFAAFVGRSRQADSIFDLVEKEYFAIRKLAARTQDKPTVFTEVRFGDTWYMPGGGSFMAKLIADAGGQYLWAGNKEAGSIPLSFEQVYAKAAQAQYWINLSAVKSRKELLALDTRYAGFKAYTDDKLYNNTRRVNALGYSEYWESGMYHPERILNDLRIIFTADSMGSLYYYKKLE